MGDDLPDRSGATGASPVAAVPVRARRRGPVCHSLAVLAQAAADHGGVRDVCPVLRHLPFHRGVCPRTGRATGLSGLELADYGPSALRTDDRWRAVPDLAGVSPRPGDSSGCRINSNPGVTAPGSRT